MSFSNTYTTLITTVLKRYGIQILEFNDSDFSILNYSSDKVEKFPIKSMPSDKELDSIVDYLNECPITCSSDSDIPNEDNC